MARFFRWWLGLAPTAVLTSFVAAFVGFRQVDLSFPHFATLLVVPVIQAGVLTWRAARPADLLAGLAWETWRHPFAQPILLLDVVVLGGGLVGWEVHRLGFGAPVNVQAAWVLVKIAAGVVCLAVALGRTSGGARITMAGLACAPLVLAWGMAPSTSWVAAGFGWWRDAVGERGEVLHRLGWYGILFVAMATWTLLASRHLARHSTEASRWFEVMLVPAVAVAVITVLATFNLPELTQPGLGAAEACASVGATCALLGTLFLAWSGRPSGDGTQA